MRHVDALSPLSSYLLVSEYREGLLARLKKAQTERGRRPKEDFRGN